jgi:hypothetical protein
MSLSLPAESFPLPPPFRTLVLPVLRSLIRKPDFFFLTVDDSRDEMSGDGLLLRATLLLAICFRSFDRETEDITDEEDFGKSGSGPEGGFPILGSTLWRGEVGEGCGEDDEDVAMTGLLGGSGNAANS